MRKPRVPSPFTKFAKATARLSGRPGTFVLVVGLVAAWAISGPFFGYSDSWQLTINTATTIVTFLMVFLIQATQNRDGEAIQIKLDELIRCQQGAHNALLDLEELEEDDLVRMRANYLALADQARKALRAGRGDTGVAPIDESHRAVTGRVKGGKRTPR